MPSENPTQSEFQAHVDAANARIESLRQDFNLQLDALDRKFNKHLEDHGTEPPPEPPEPPTTDERPWILHLHFNEVEGALTDPKYAHFNTLHFGNVHRAEELITKCAEAGKRVYITPATSSQFQDEGNLPGRAFNMDKWKAAAVDAWRHLPMEEWFQAGILVGAYLMDEPYRKSVWGQPGLTGPEMDEMAHYYKTMAPSAVTHIRMRPSGFPEYTFKHLDGGVIMYSWAKPFTYNPKVYHGYAAYVQKELAAADARGFSRDKLLWGAAVLHGGQPNDGTEAVPEPGKWGLPIWEHPTYDGSHQGGWFMRPEEIDLAAELTAHLGMGAWIFRHHTNSGWDWDENRTPRHREWLAAIEAYGEKVKGAPPVEPPVEPPTVTPIMTWGLTQEDHDKGTPLTDDAILPSTAFFYIVNPDNSEPLSVNSVVWSTSDPTRPNYVDNGYPWRWLVDDLPPGDHWVEAVINGDTIIRHTFKVGDAPLPPDPPEPPASADFYGPGLASGGMHARGASLGRPVAFPWTAPRSGQVKDLALYWIFASHPGQYGPTSEQHAYSHGNGGDMQVSVRPDRDGPVLGSYRLTHPMAPGGFFHNMWKPGGVFNRGGYLGFLGLNQSVTVEAGKTYWIQVDNFEPGDNYTGIDGAAYATGPGPRVWLGNNGAWTRDDSSYDNGTSGFAPMYAVRYDDGQISSQAPYADTGAGHIDISGRTAVQLLNLPAGTLNEVKVFVEHGGTIHMKVNQDSYASSGPAGWHIIPTDSSVNGLTRFEFTGDVKLQGLWKYWGDDSTDWGGGALLDGQPGWPIWGANRPADIAMAAYVSGGGSPLPPDPPPVVEPVPPINGPSAGATRITQNNLDHINDPEIVLEGDFQGLSHRPRPGQLIWLDGGKFDGNGSEFLFRNGPSGWDIKGVPGTNAEVYNYGRPGSQRAAVDFRDPDWPSAGRYDTGKGAEVCGFTIRDIKGEAIHYGGTEGHIHDMNLLRSEGGVLIAGWGHSHILEDSLLAGGGVVGSSGHESGNSKLFAQANTIVRRVTIKGARGGPGLWFDGMCIDPIIEDVVVKDTDGPGIFLEIGFGGTIRRVLCERTNLNWGGAWGGAAFAISMTDQVTMEDCTAKDSKGAVIVTYQPFRQAEFWHFPEFIRKEHGRSEFGVAGFRSWRFTNDNSGQIGAAHDGGSPSSVLDDVLFTDTTMLGNTHWVGPRAGWT